MPNQKHETEVHKPIRRAGRPKASEAGDVDTRLLDAATHLFLSLGYEGTSCEQVVVLAGAGKASLYARYANKEALFEAVVRRSVQAALESPQELAADLTLPERLHHVGLEILKRSIEPEKIAMMRLIIATAGRFPELAQLADKIGWEGGVVKVTQAILLNQNAPGPRQAQARVLAERFVALTFAPQQLRALLGDSQTELQARASSCIDDAITLLTRSGWLKEWET